MKLSWTTKKFINIIYYQMFGEDGGFNEVVKDEHFCNL